MIEIKPQLNIPCTCPECGCKDPNIKGFIFQGMYPLVESECNCCEAYYYHTLPVFSDAVFPIGISKKSDKTRYDQKVSEMAEPLIQSLRSEEKYIPSVVKIIYKEYKEVIILDCLDTDYGNIFYKIINAYRHLEKDSDKGLIMVIPSSMMWMVPEGIAEVWIVEARIFRLNKFIRSLNEFYHQEQSRFEKVYIGKTTVHPDLNNIPMELFLKEKKFDPSQFEDKPFQITFSLREDQFWLTSKWNQFLLRTVIRFNLLSSFKSYFCFIQNRNCSLFTDKISKVIKNSSFAATGIGKTGKLGKNIKDERRLSDKEDPMQYWTKTYAASDLCIGLHGDHMMIPKALCGDFIEIQNSSDVDRKDGKRSAVSDQLHLPGISELIKAAIHILIEKK